MRSAIILFCVLAISCDHQATTVQPQNDTISAASTLIDTANQGEQKSKQNIPPPSGEINTGTTKPAELLAFANTLIGTPYKYGSTDPAEGFDCSGFITHVFNHFKIAVPRSSVDFTNVGTEVTVEESKPGDLILFTGTDSTIRVVGHMGIVITSGSDLQFIHSSSGKANGVTVTPLNPYYRGRFIKVIRIFP